MSTESDSSTSNTLAESVHHMLYSPYKLFFSIKNKYKNKPTHTTSYLATSFINNQYFKFYFSLIMQHIFVIE